MLGVFSQMIKSFYPYRKEVIVKTNSNKKKTEVIVDRPGNEVALNYLRSLFKNKTENKIKAGSFNGPEIRLLFNNLNEFKSKLSKKEKPYFETFFYLYLNFFGNNRSADYAEKVKQLMSEFKSNDVLMSTKVHYLFEHLDRFPTNCGGLNEQKGENFHQEIQVREKRYKLNFISMLQDFCWSKNLQTDLPFRKIRNTNYFDN